MPLTVPSLSPVPAVGGLLGLGPPQPPSPEGPGSPSPREADAPPSGRAEKRPAAAGLQPRTNQGRV